MDDWNLRVTVKNCSNLENKDLESGSDPFVAVSISESLIEKKTHHKLNNLNPVYNEDFHFFNVNSYDMVRFRVIDREFQPTNEDDSLGEATLMLSSVPLNQPTSYDLDLSTGEGTLSIDVLWKGGNDSNQDTSTQGDDGWETTEMGESIDSNDIEVEGKFSVRSTRRTQNKHRKFSTNITKNTRINRGKIPESRWPPFMHTTTFASRDSIEKMEQGQSVSSPSHQLQLEFIYGSSQKGCKGNILHVNNQGRLVYIAAACGVVYDVDRHSQLIIQGHMDDCVSIAKHPDGITFATGETGLDDFILIWNSETGEILKKLPTHLYFKPGGNLAMSFHPNGDLLAVVGGTKEQCSLCVWDWAKGKLIGKCDLAKKDTYALEWSPSGDQIVWCARDVVKFIQVSGSGISTRNAIISSAGGKLQQFFCVTFDDDGNAIVGTRSGSLYFFKGNQLARKMKAHKGSCRSLYRTPNGFVSGGADGNLNVYVFDGSSACQCQASYPLGDYCRSVCVDPNSPHIIYVFENDGDIIRIDSKNGTAQHLLYGHSGLRAELWGLDVVPRSPYFVSAGDDGRVLLFDRSNRRLVGQVASKRNQFRSVSVSPNGEHVALGSVKGDLYVLALQAIMDGRVDTLKSIDTNLRTNEELSVIRYSPSGQYLAVGGGDCNIYVFNAQENYSRVATLRAHSSRILQIDWTSDEKHLRSVCQAHELLHWNASGSWTRDLVSSDDNVDFEWATNTCTLSWEVRGIWDMKRYNDASDINSCDSNFDLGLLASGDDLGCVNLLSYPTFGDRVPIRSHIGHCSHVTSVRFSDDNMHLLSAGGGDLCVLQWKIV